MHQHIKDQWVTALRSGRYGQATGTLANSSEAPTGADACCLGVLGLENGCVLPHPGPGSLLQPDGSRADGLLTVGFAVDVLGVPVDIDGLRDAPWSARPEWPKGLLTADAGVTLAAMSYSTLNDEVGLTFDQIADIIQAFGVV